jgi:thiamine-phosphate pyrophosphorylase
MHTPVVHLITDRRLVPDLVAHAERALAGFPPGCIAVHVREKELRGAELLVLSRALVAVCRRHGQRCLVNDRLDVALAAGADGVHLPSAGIPPAAARRLAGPEALIGVSCHGLADVRRALAGGASFATFGPVHDTPSKRPWGAPVGLEALRGAAGLGLPLVGLGGVTPENAAEVRAAGASGVAAIRAWLEAVEPAGAVRALMP